MHWFRALFKKKTSSIIPTAAPVFFTNTLSGNKETFVSIKPGLVLLYTCGPTVYGPALVGNLRAYIFSDTIVRALEGAGYRVKRVINITDFGHLVSDGDEGEDKMTKGLKREHMKLTMENMHILAERYADTFIADLESLAVDVSVISFPRASDYVAEQIALISTLEQKEYAYRTKAGVYFDTSRFPSYGKLGHLNLEAQQESGRALENIEKRHPADFVLWKPDAKLGWPSPWGHGFPGWHVECSAMSRALLGQEIDIHTGGEDHIAVHHNNEIAQSEAASGRTFVHYWMHNAFLTAGGEKISKSLGNGFTLADVVEKGIHPLALRYFFLQAHYRTPLSFSFDALAGAAEALNRLWKFSREISTESLQETAPSEALQRFLAAMRDDLATPQAIGILWESLKSEDLTPEEKWGLLVAADEHLGLSLKTPPVLKTLAAADLSPELQDILTRREEARKKGDFVHADLLRDELQKRGYRVDDGLHGPVLTPTTL
ncbi:MAG: cysteine--tRNA ligase [Patescibacteria group bacterium]